MDLGKLEKIFHKECKILGPGLVLLGFSGGPDSLALFDILISLQIPFAAAHFDHQLRKESVIEAEQAEAMAREYSVLFFAGTEDVKMLAKKEKLTIESAARAARYRFLFKTAREINAQAIAVAHTADDQVETVFMHILRGTGLTGLRGMQYRTVQHEWIGDIPIIRPLLEIWRNDIFGYVNEKGLRPILDRSNLELDYHRNRLRLQLIPELEGYNPGFKRAILRMAQSVNNDAELIEYNLQQVWQEVIREEKEHSITLGFNEVKSLVTSLQRLILRNSVARLLGGPNDIDFEVIERGRSFINEPPKSKHVQLIRGIDLYLIEDALVLSTGERNLPRDAWPQLLSEEKVLVSPPFKLHLNSNWMLEGEIIDNLLSSLPQKDPFIGTLDAEKLQFPLVIRGQISGDRFNPFGMGDKKIKLSDFWIDQKIPRWLRQKWPLILSMDQIIWVAGKRPAEQFRLTKETRKVLRLRLIRS